MRLARDRSGLTPPARARGAAAGEGSAAAAAPPAEGTGAGAGVSAASSGGRWRPLRSVLRDRRGATALVFAGAAVSLFGLVALATEGGNWYFTQRNARSAADMAALAGASAYLRADSAQDAAAVASATETAKRNGFAPGPDTTVQVTVGSWTPPSPPYPAGTAALPGAVRVTIERTVPTFLAGLLLGNDAVTIRVRATAAVTNSPGPACILATARSGIGLTMLGNATVKAQNCVLHANSTSSDGVKIQSNFASTLEALGVSVAGGCVGNACDALPNVPGNHVQRDAGRISNPYADLQAIVARYNLPPSAQRIDVPNNTNFNVQQFRSRIDAAISQNGSAPVVFYGTTNNKNLSLGNGMVLDLPSNRTYVFWNAGLDLSNGTLRCMQCTFVFTGDNGQAGGVRINGQALVQIETKTGAPNTPLPSSISGQPIVGVSMYRDARASNNLPGGGYPVQINGTSGSYINGALVFPESDVLYNGTYTGGAGTGSGLRCNIVIGRTIDFSGNATLDTSACEANGVRRPILQVVRLVE